MRCLLNPKNDSGRGENVWYACLIFFLVFLPTAFVEATPVGPFPVGTTPSEPRWESPWGYTVDGQAWGNWFRIEVPWGTTTEMSDDYVIQEDFLIWVNPSTSGLANPSSIYGADWWNHDGVYGLGEFFDAGKQPGDQNYVLTLDVVNGIWAVWYDGNRNGIKEGGAEHDILAGTIDSYWNYGGYFYGVLTDSDGRYNGFFTSSHDEDTPLLINPTFHAGSPAPIPEPTTVLLVGTGLAGLLGFRKKFRKSTEA